MNKDIQAIIKFLIVIDEFKEIKRMVLLANGKRQENDAEHTWHLTMMTWLLSSYYEKPLDITKTIKLALMHDLCEVYAGDTFGFDEKGRKGKKVREEKAAKKLFSKLPSKLKNEFMQLFEEYEEKSSEEAKFVNSVDKLQPFMLNVANKGKGMRKYKITREMIEKTMKKHHEISPLNMSIFNNLLDKTKKGSLDKVDH